MANNLTHDLEMADKLRNEGQWQSAIKIYEKIMQSFPGSASLQHNLAVCYFALGQHRQSLSFAKAAVHLDQHLWQSEIILAKSKKELGEVTEAFQLFEKLSQQKPVNGEALLGMADILLNIYGDPLKAIQTIQPLFDINDFAEDARLTELMASLYDRDESAESLTDRIKLFSKTSMQLNRDENSFQFKENTLKKSLKPRVGIISPMFQVSPVYFLTVDFFKKIASQCDLIFFNRGTKSDWATDAFKEIGSEWHEVSFFDPITLAQTIHDQDIDVLYDLGGWMDPLALKALSLKPARQQFKWVGGQSVTTGLDCFDGWMGDTWHTPQHLQHLYTEPLINKSDDYVTYTPPPYMPKPLARKRDEIAIFANPAKLSRAFLKELNALEGPKHFIHRQFQHDASQGRVLSMMHKKDITFICPESHKEALDTINQYHTLVDTFPYSSGLTAREAVTLGTQIRVLHVGSLFCERHTARYAASST
jgi:predicted O-linked N-acetylglucosamine transferase (SPINDLY family)